MDSCQIKLIELKKLIKTKLSNYLINKNQDLRNVLLDWFIKIFVTSFESIFCNSKLNGFMLSLIKKVVIHLTIPLYPLILIATGIGNWGFDTYFIFKIRKLNLKIV